MWANGPGFGRARLRTGNRSASTGVIGLTKRVRGGPTTGRCRARRASTARRRRCIRTIGAAVSGTGASRRLPGDEGVRRGRGCGTGGIREGVLRARTVPKWSVVQALAAQDRDQRGSQPASIGGASGRPVPANGTGAPLGGRGPVSRGGRSREREAPSAAGCRQLFERGGSARGVVPLFRRALGGRDGAGSRMRTRNRQITSVARSRAASRGDAGGGGA